MPPITPPGQDAQRSGSQPGGEFDPDQKHGGGNGRIGRTLQETDVFIGMCCVHRNSVGDDSGDVSGDDFFNNGLGRVRA